MNQEKIKECFEHIVKYWKEESYKGCFQEWKKIELFIVKYPKEAYFSGYECSCGTKWTDLKFINKIDNICPACDVSCQPFLSNPKNRENVIKYIPKKYHKYIFTDFECEKIVEDINVSLIPCKQEKQNEMDIVKKVKEEAKTSTPVRVGIPDSTKQKIQLLKDIDDYRRQGYVDGRNYSMESSLEDLLMGYSRIKKRCEEDEVRFQQELISLLDKELKSQNKTEKRVKEEENSAKVRE